MISPAFFLQAAKLLVQLESAREELQALSAELAQRSQREHDLGRAVEKARAEAVDAVAAAKEEAQRIVGAGREEAMAEVRRAMAAAEAAAESAIALARAEAEAAVMLARSEVERLQQEVAQLRGATRVLDARSEEVRQCCPAA